MALVIAVHGGAGPRPAPEKEPRIAAGLETALAAGHAILAGGGRALDAVQAAVASLEDDPVFNAGRGGARTQEGAVELDATIMDGATRATGAVAALVGVRHPVDAARAVLEDGRHVLLAGEGALAFARARGVELRPADWFAHDGRAATESTAGTVGAVARDAASHLAAATSTGGRRGQLAGRLGDSAVPGAGTWADDATAAVSCTGDGEAFIRAMVAHEIDALVRHRDLPLEVAARVALQTAARHGGEGGLIALDRHGTIATPVTSPAMSHGWRVDGAAPQIAMG